MSWRPRRDTELQQSHYRNSRLREIRDGTVKSSFSCSKIGVNSVDGWMMIGVNSVDGTIAVATSYRRSRGTTTDRASVASKRKGYGSFSLRHSWQRRTRKPGARLSAVRGGTEGTGDYSQTFEGTFHGE